MADGPVGELLRRLDEIQRSLDSVSRLLALSVAKGLPRREQIEVLDSAGLPPRDIANLLRTTANAVSVELTRIRVRAKRRPSKTGKRPKP